MNLYIHVGIHKTGSSYLQTLFARNRDLLAEHSIYYSKSERDKEMLKGRISPGNALKLNKLLRDSKYEEVKKYLQRLVLQAEKINCKSVLLSNEGLFHIFAKEGTVLNFIEIYKTSRFKNIHGLVYFRDPLDHILSLYKNRAKSGKHLDFKIWLYV